MAKALKPKKRKVVSKKAVGSRVPRDRKDEFVVVGTYKEKQRAWIEKNGVYNYPVREGDDFNDAALRAVRELWLFANVKSECYAFAVTGYLGKMSKAEFNARYQTYAKLGKQKSNAYYVFKVTKLDYKPTVNTEIFIARTADFGKRSAKVKKAIAQFKADGEFAPLSAYLPKDLSQVPPKQLRVSEPWVQMELWSEIPSELSIEQVAETEHTSIKVVRRLVASGQLRSIRRGSRYYIPQSALKFFKEMRGAVADADVRLNSARVHFVPGRGIDPEQRDMRKRGKRVGAGISRRIRNRRGVSSKVDTVNWQDIRGCWDNPGKSRAMTFVDLFCGAGGLSKGLEMAA